MGEVKTTMSYKLLKSLVKTKKIFKKDDCSSFSNKVILCKYGYWVSDGRILFLITPTENPVKDSDITYEVYLGAISDIIKSKKSSKIEITFTEGKHPNIGRILPQEFEERSIYPIFVDTFFLSVIHDFLKSLTGNTGIVLFRRKDNLPYEHYHYYIGVPLVRYYPDDVKDVLIVISGLIYNKDELAKEEFYIEELLTNLREV